MENETNTSGPKVPEVMVPEIPDTESALHERESDGSVEDRIEYLNKNIELFWFYNNLQFVRGAFKSGYATEEEYKAAREAFSEIQDEITEWELGLQSQNRLSEGSVEEEKDGQTEKAEAEKQETKKLPARYYLQSWSYDQLRKELASLNGIHEVTIVETPEVLDSDGPQEKPKTENPEKNFLNETDAYSGRLHGGDKVIFDGKMWELLGYDTRTSNARLSRKEPGAKESTWTVVTQKKLYDENPPAVQEKSADESSAMVEGKAVVHETEASSASAFSKDGALDPEKRESRLLADKEVVTADEKREKINSLKRELSNGYDELIKGLKGKDENLQGQIDVLRQKLTDLEKRLVELNRVENGSEYKKAARETYDKANTGGVQGIENTETPTKKKKHSWFGNLWGFIGERTKGALTLGGLEVYSALKFQFATKKAEKGMKELAEDITHEENLTPEEKLAQHERTMEKLGQGSISREGYDYLSRMVSMEKSEANNVLIEKIIDQAIEDLKGRLNKKSWLRRGYKTANTGREVMTEENIAALRAELRAELGKMRDGQIRKDGINFKAVMRKNLDKRWWMRYIYGPLEAATILGLAAHHFGWLAAKGASNVAEKGGEVLLKDTIWQEAQRQLVNAGINHPTNAQTLKVAYAIAKENAVKVIEWGLNMGSSVVDTAMAKGSVLKMGAGLKEIAVIKGGILAAGAGV